MKTKEFIEKVNELGFDTECRKNPFSNVSIRDYDLITVYLKDQNLVKIWTHCQYAISTISDGHSCFITGDDVDKLYELCFEYASTPVEDREEEKKYLLLHKFVLSKNSNAVNLAYNKNKGIYRLINCKWNNYIYKVLFTEKEIEELKEKFNTNLEDFELIEVEDEKV